MTTLALPETATASTTHEDESRTYPYPLTGEEFWSVTTIIGGTKNKPWLEAWVAKSATTWILDHLDQLESLGREAFMAEAKRASKEIRKLKAEAGVYCHDVVESLILWQAAGDRAADIPLPSLPEHLEGQFVDDMPIEQFADMCIVGFLNFVSDHDPRFIAAEMKVYNPDLKVAGTLDFIAELDKLHLTPCVDVKTGKHLDGVKEQVPMYRRMTECLMPMGVLAPMPATDCGMVLHLRPEYESGYRLMLISAEDDALGYNRFRRAARLFNERETVKGKPGKALYPPLPDGSQPAPLLADLDGEGYGLIIRPLTKAGLRTVADVAEFTRADCLAIKGVGKLTILVIEKLLTDHGLSFTPEPEMAVAA